MEDLIAQLGVPGIMIYLIFQDVMRRRNGKPVANPNHDKTRAGDVSLQHFEKRFDRIEEQGRRSQETLVEIKTILKERLGRGS